MEMVLRIVPCGGGFLCLGWMYGGSTSHVFPCLVECRRTGFGLEDQQGANSYGGGLEFSREEQPSFLLARHLQNFSTNGLKAGMDAAMMTT